ncbi:RNA-directed DNA polymerase [Tanacetum coccineum]|uniref:RNA-directed DNA polymerase n=1 Tax=Tanacetum coccineum TaxID=301880 RepID=A0ABQ5EW37_9ASTR
MLERLAEHEYYCFLDGFSRYFQILVAPEDQEKTTFNCPYGTMAYKRMPFGLCNAPTTFQHYMMAIFHELIEDSMEIFMNDFSISGSSFDHCLQNLEKMLKRCEETNLILNWKKCHFMPSKSGEEGPPVEINMKNEVERRTDDEPVKGAKENVMKNKEDEPTRVSGSYAVRGPVYKTILKKKITKKKDIGGNFEIPCNIGSLKHMNALVDQGSDVNVMPLSTYEKLTNERHVKTDIRLSLASHSYIYPLGIEEDLLVDVAGHIEKGIKNDIEPIAPTMTVNILVLEWEEKIKLHQEKEMKFDQWRSKIFNNEHPASIKEECEVENKGEVT